MKKNVVLGLFAVLGGFLAIAGYKAVEDNKSLHKALQVEEAPFQQASYSPHAAVNGPDFVDAAEKTVHAVVHIKTEYQQKNTLYDFFFGDFFNYNPQGRSKPFVATGSGVIISEDGYIVTNNHVVQDADYIEVTLNDKRSFEAKIIGNDPSTDIALVKISENSLPFLAFGNSDAVRIGEWVLAVGNPFNLTSTVTAGIVSAKARNINILGDKSAIESFIQTDAAVNPGNSGGALVNTTGDLIGINAAIASNTGSYSGYSFAIPSNLVKKVVEDLRDYGVVQRGYLGITPADITSDFARDKGIDKIRGVYVYGVADDGSAKDAGMHEGDIITNVNTIPVNSVSELLEIVGQYRPGDKVDLTYERDGKVLNNSIQLKNKEGNMALVKKEDISVLQELGAEFAPVTDVEKKWLRIDHGVKISNLSEGLLSNQGIRKNFIITSIDRNPVKSKEDIEKVMKGKEGGVLIEGIYPNGMKAYYMVVLK